MGRRVLLFTLCLLAAAFVAISATFVLGDYQGQGGDFAQYVIHARNLMLGRPYGWLVEGFPFVLPGYPLALAGLTAVFGVDFFAYAVFNSLCWAGCAMLTYVFFRSRLATPTEAVAFVSVALFSLFATHFQQDVQPNIVYAFAAMAALVASQHLGTNAHPSRHQLVLAVVALLLPLLLRKESLALCAALCVYFALHRRWLLAGVPVLGIVAIATFDILAVEAFDLNSTFQNFARRYLSDADPQGASPLARRDIGFPLAFVYAIATYLVALVEFAVPTAFARWSAVTLEFAPGATVHLSPVSVGVIAAFAWSYFRGNLFTLDRLFLAAHLAVVALFSILWIKSGQIPTRYALPVYGIFWFHVFAGLAPIVRRAVPLPTVRTVLGAGVVAAAVLASTSQWDAPLRRNDTRSPEIAELVRWLAENHTGGEIGFAKNRTLIMLLDEIGHPRTTVSRLRSSAEAERLLDDPDSLLVVRTAGGYGQPEVMAFADAAGAPRVFQNKRVVVYRAQASQGEGSDRR